MVIRSKSSAQIAMCLGSILMGFVGLFINALNKIPTTAVASLRGFFGAVILFVFLFSFKKLNIIKELFQKVPFLTIIQGLLSSSTIIFYFLCITTLGYGVAAFLLYTGPIFAVLFMWVGLNHVPSKKDILAFVVVMVGIAFLVNPFGTQIQENVNIGFLYGILSGLSAGVLNFTKGFLFNKWDQLIEKGGDSSSLKKSDTIYINLGLATIATFILFLVFVGPSIRYYPTLIWSDWLIAIGLGLFPTAIAFSLVNYGVREDKGGDVLIFGYSETLVGTALTAIIDQNLTLSLIIGGTLVILANIIVIRNKKK